VYIQPEEDVDLTLVDLVLEYFAEMSCPPGSISPQGGEYNRNRSMPTVWAFFRQRRVAEAAFDPGGNAGFVHTCLLHVVQIFVSGDGSAAQAFVVDSAQKQRGFSGFHLRFDEIAHSGKILALRAVCRQRRSEPDWHWQLQF